MDTATHTELDHEIQNALTQLRQARADAAHSPNANSIRARQQAEHMLNRLLDARHALNT